MSSPLENEETVNNYGVILRNVLNKVIGAVIPNPNISLVDTTKSSAQNIYEGYSDGVFLPALEDKTHFELGFIFRMKDISMIADLMLMGDGQSKESLDDAHRDAVLEITNQIYGAIRGSIDAQIGKTFKFNVEGVDKLTRPEQLQADSYVSFDIAGEVRGLPFQFRHYIEESFVALLEPNDDSTGIQDAMEFMDGMNTAGSGGANSSSGSRGAGGGNMDMLIDIEVPVSVRMGSAKLFLKDILGLGPGNIVELDQGADDAIELVVNDKIIARGEVVIVDGYFGFRIKEIVSKAERIRKLKD